VEIVELPAQLHADAVSLWHEVGLTRPWNDPVADLALALSGLGSTVLAACEGDARLLGTAMVGHDGHRAWVYYLAVRPSSQGQGLGRALMEACERWAREHGMPKLQLMVRRGNEGVLAFYEALGYTDDEVVVLGRRLAEPQAGDRSE
jgi:ribosomal protein S18 acetylase RimI-like enzyme